jgi:hypothetical protein
MLKKADATDNNTGDFHTSRATLDTTGVRRKRSPRSFSNAERDAVASIGGIRRPNITLGWLEAGRFRIQAPRTTTSCPRGDLRHRPFGGWPRTGHGELRLARRALRTKLPFAWAKGEAQPMYCTPTTSIGLPPALTVCSIRDRAATSPAVARLLLPDTWSHRPRGCPRFPFLCDSTEGRRPRRSHGGLLLSPDRSSQLKHALSLVGKTTWFASTPH